MAEKPLTARQIERRARTPKFDVYIVSEQAGFRAQLMGRRERAGDAIVQVTGVAAPFTFLISAAMLKEHAPLGHITTSSVMQMARDFARQECEQRLLLGRGRT